jgi:NADH-quinone oxidoreductase subunit G
MSGDTVRFAWVSRQTNARGAVDAGLVPGLLPGGRALDDPGPVADAWNRVPSVTGRDTRRMLEAARDGELKALVLVGADPISDFEDPRLAEQALAAVESVISLDLLPTASNRYADVLLPACAPQERVGSFTTWEGRRQPFGQIVPPQGLCLEDWDILRQIARAMGTDMGWETAMDVRREAAPLMVGVAGPTALADLAPGEVEPRRVHDDGALDALVVDALIGRGTLLVGAKELKATARSAVVVMNAGDAAALGFADGDLVDVTGPEGQLRLPVHTSETVVAGAAVLPGGATPMLPGAMRDPEQRAESWLRVRVAAVEKAAATA